MSTIVKDLGAVSAYAYAVEKGYTGTEEEFAELMASYATVGQTAVNAAQTATTKASEAATSAIIATNKASEATTAAQTASTKASEAVGCVETATQKATEATQSASQASGYAQTAETAKTDAQTAKTQAETARDNAVTAKTAAETAQGKAETAQEAAEDAAESVSASAAQIATNTSDISDLKEDLNNLYFSPSTAPGYWGANGVIFSQSSMQEVYTEWLVPLGDKIKYKLSYPETHNTWICVLYEFSNGNKQRVIVRSGDGVSFDGVITIPADVVRLSLSYRTYGDCTFAICGIFKDLTEAEKQKLADALTAEDIVKFGFDYPLVNDLELVEIINSSASYRSNWSANVLNGLYLLVPEMASDSYSYEITCNTTLLSVLNASSNITYIPNTKINFCINPSASDGHKLYIYKISEGQALSMAASMLDKVYPLTLAIDNYYYHMRVKSFDVLPPSNNRVSSDVFNYYGRFKVHLADSTTYKVAIQTFSRETRTKKNDSGWKSDGYEFAVYSGCCFVIVLARQDNAKIDINDIPNGLVSVEALEIAGITPPAIKDIELLNAKMDDIPVAEMSALIPSVDSTKIQALINLRNVSPIYDHLFVNGIDAKIPHESLYHLRLSKALGYKIIEANTRATSDGVIVVNHFNNGKFGSYFHHVDGVTDISNIDVNTVTWDWIVENVRYNSAIPKYRTRPSRLEEFLEECNRQNMIPFVSVSATGAIAMADKYMGHYNYICYGGTRATCPYGIIFTWNMTNTTKEQILATCDAIGNPMIYGMGNPQAFTDAELLEIIEALHAKGYTIATSYQDGNWSKYRGMGFDFNGSQTMINRIEDGNLCNYSAIYGWDDFNIAGSPTNNDNVLTFANSGTIVPKLSADTYPVSGYDFEIVFNGQIEVVTNGTGGTKTYTSDGSYPVFCACPVLNDSPNVTINVSENTIVYDLYFKAKRFY